MEHPLDDHGFSKSGDKDLQPTYEKTDDFYLVSEILKGKKILKAQTLKLLKSTK